MRSRSGRIRPSLMAGVLVLALVAAACSNDTGSNTGGGGGGGSSSNAPPTAGTTPLDSVGQGEGELNLIAWEGYTQPQWVKPFEQDTGCEVNAKYGGSSDEMVSLMRNGGGGQWDMVSASGDADL